MLRSNLSINFIPGTTEALALTCSFTMMLSGCTKSAQDAATKTTYHELAIITPLADGVINSSNKSAFPIGGSCKVNGVSVTWVAEDDLTPATSLTGTLSCASNVWSGAPDLQTLDEGVVYLTLTQVEAVGTTASATVGLVKNTAPSLAVNAPAVGYWINSTNKASVAVTGTCSEDGQLVSFTAGATGAPVVCALGVWSQSLDFSANSSEGAVSITVSHVNASGNSITATGNFTKDTIAPTSPTEVFVGPVPNSLAYTPQLTFSGETDGSGSGINLTEVELYSNVIADGLVAFDSSVTSPLAISGLSLSHSKNYYFAIRLTDAAGNSSTSVFSGNFTPAFSDVTPTLALATSAPSPTNAPTISAKVDLNIPVTNLTLDATAFTVIHGSVSNIQRVNSSQFTFDITPTSGQFDVTVKMNAGQLHDGWSNSNTESALLTIAYDSIVTPLAVATTTLNDIVKRSNMSAFSLSGTCEGTANVTISSVDGSGVQIGSSLGTAACSAISATASGTWTKEVDLSAPAAGILHLKVSQSDALTNSGSATVDIAKDLSLPTIAITTPSKPTGLRDAGQDSLDTTFIKTANANYAIEGSCTGPDSNNAGISIKLDGTEIKTTTCNGTTHTFATTVNTSRLDSNSNPTGWTDSTHVLTATITEVVASSPAIATSTGVSVYSWQAPATVTWDAVKALFTTGSNGGLTCVDCHYRNTSPSPATTTNYGYADGAASQSFGEYNACVSTGNGGLESNGVCGSAVDQAGREAFKFKFGYFDNPCTPVIVPKTLASITSGSSEITVASNTGIALNMKVYGVGLPTLTKTGATFGSGALIVTGLVGTTGLVPGATVTPITGVIASGTVIVSVDSNTQISLSKVTLSEKSNSSLSFSQPYAVVNGLISTTKFTIEQTPNATATSTLSFFASTTAVNCGTNSAASYLKVNNDPNTDIFRKGIIIVNDESTDDMMTRSKIVRGKPLQSMIFRKINATTTAGKAPLMSDLYVPRFGLVGKTYNVANQTARMPMSSSYFSNESISTVNQWILEGARTTNDVPVP